MRDSAHYSVLLEESVAALVTDPEGCYIDGTFGRGGHSRAILAALGDAGRLMGFDKDPEAVKFAEQLGVEDSRFSIAHSSFTEMPLKLQGEKVQGVLLDLGVSSPQLDQADRGFSFLQDGPLDMRMNNSTGLTASDWINTAKAEDIAFVLKEYGEERFAKRMARAVVEARDVKPITTTSQFAEIISVANPKWEKGKHPATRAFQAVRIYINNELEDLKQALSGSLEVLKPGGRLVVISFHSLEDRLVKRFIRNESRGKEFPRGLPITEDMRGIQLKTIGKALKAGESELVDNIRSRSAVMRVAERL